MQHTDYRSGGSSVANEAGFRIDSWDDRLSKHVNRLHEIFHLPLHAAEGLRAPGNQSHG